MKEGRMVAIPTGEWHDYKATKRMTGKEFYDRFEDELTVISVSRGFSSVTDIDRAEEAAKRASGLS